MDTQNIDWRVPVGLLVNGHGFSMEDAWRCTMNEFSIVTNFQVILASVGLEPTFDKPRLDDFQEHLRSLGVDV